MGFDRDDALDLAESLVISRIPISPSMRRQLSEVIGETTLEEDERMARAAVYRDRVEAAARKRHEEMFEQLKRHRL